MGDVVSFPNTRSVDFAATAIARRDAWEAEMDATSAGNSQMQTLMRGTLTCSAELAAGLDHRIRGLRAAETRVHKWMARKAPLDPDVARCVLERIGMIVDDLGDGVESPRRSIEQRMVCHTEREAWTLLGEEIRRKLAATRGQATSA